MKKSFIALLLVCASIFSLISCEHEHKWEDWQTETPAMVLTDGLEYRTCKCGERETRSIPKIGVENELWGEWKCVLSDDMCQLLSFSSEQSAKYSLNVRGVEVGILYFTYKVDGTVLTLTQESGTELIYRLQDLGDDLKIIDENDNEFLHVE
jgi:uncharacterized lipoprotein YehR (DUF1307 family)